MSLLTPLYIAGLLGISLPILFHLIRRSPSGQVPFSSLMFLSPSPPRLTRRSRIDHWLLLLLRALVLLLLVLAFARPFLRKNSEFIANGLQGRRIAVLLDTSASMQRPGAWEQVVKEVDLLLEELAPEDRTAIYRFDQRVTEVAGFDHSLRTNQQQRHGLLKNQVQQLSPSWSHTELGLALSTVATELVALADQDEVHVGASLQVILISDLQQGAALQHLEAFEWPENVKLQIRTVSAPEKTNASLHLVADRSQTDQADENWRLRIDNAAGSTSENYQVQWATSEGPVPGIPPSSVYVLPGKSHVMRLPERKAASWDRLVLTGDQQPFDNTLFIAPRVQETFDIGFVGPGSSKNPEDLLYYLDSVFSDDPLRNIKVVQVKNPSEINQPQNIPVKLVVASGNLDPPAVTSLRSYVSKGGHLLYVIQENTSAESLRTLLDDKDLQLQEAEVTNYAMLSDIDFSHPLFTPFASPQFRDFKTIHFWNHRQLKINTTDNRHVLARFDDHDIAMIEESLEKGKIWIMTSGWQPGDSQLARSKKFLPLMVGILERSMGVLAGVPQYSIGEEVNCLTFDQQPESITIHNPQQEKFYLEKNDSLFKQTTLPGIYRWETPKSSGFFAVNLKPTESQTATLDPSRLEQHGIQIGSQLSSEEEQEQERQMRDRELESRQKLWQWLIALAVGVILGETWLSGKLARTHTSDAKETS
ncbi:MAG: VWA domain-containing protein [Planctomycetaceae bacterium]|nr:VWA domain-containing protein [Planctomycetaceae bacterium]